MLTCSVTQVAFATRDNEMWATYAMSQSLFHWTRGATVGQEMPLHVNGRRGVSIPALEQMVKDPSKDSRFVGQYFVTRVDAKARRMCGDFKLPLPADSLAHVTFVRDTIVAVQQGTDKSGESATAIRQFAIDQQQCQWIALR